MAPDLAQTNTQDQAAPESPLHSLKAQLQAISLPAADGSGATRIRLFEKGEELVDLTGWVAQFIQPLERQAKEAAPLSEAQVRELQTALTAMVETIRLLAASARSAPGLSDRQSQSKDGAVADAPPPQHAVDPATGLPGHEDAKAAIAAKIKSSRECGLALFVVDRLAFLNAKFGRSAGDEVLLSAARHIIQTLPAGVPLFRWNGPAFAALLEIPHGLTAIERHVKKAATSRLEQTVEAGDRSVMLTVGRSYHLRRIGPSDSADSVCRSLDDFIAARSLDASRAS